MATIYALNNTYTDIKYAGTTDLTKGDDLEIGGSLCFALVDYDASEDDSVTVVVACSKVQAPKIAATAFTAGDVVYWDATNDEITDASTGNTEVGVCVEDAALADTVIYITWQGYNFA